VVFQQSISLTQSSFTAECQNAKQAGTNVWFLAMDGSAAQRVASSCNSVGFHPTYVTAGIAASKNALDDPNIKAAGFYIGSNEAPFIMNDTPALKTYHAAFEQFYGGPPPDQSTMKGWVSGQLFAAAINKLGAAARKGPITTDMVYQGLYLLRNETLGGLIPPMNYTKGKAAPLVNCYTTIKDTKAGIVAPAGSRFTCL
jgi:branched-chain amino acid transport system substrate-binding protein